MSAHSADLIGALGVGLGSVVSFVGAGGKTSLLFALAIEAAQRWGPERVLITTTTKMLGPGPEDFPSGAPIAARGEGTSPRPRLALADSLESAVQTVQARGPGELLVLGTRFAGEAEGRSKFAGFSPEWIDDIAHRFPEVVILVEADGSARKPLKAPAAHEPVIPACTTVVVAVAGIDAIGMPLDAAHVHRPERLAQLTAHAPGNPVTSEVIATALWHEAGCAKGRSPSALLVPVINKVDGPVQLGVSHEAAGKLMELGAPRVLLTSCRGWPVVVEAIGGGVTAAAIVLAAGVSARMGTPKQLLLWEGEPLVVRTVRETLSSRVDPVVVVLGHVADEIRAALEPLMREAGDRLRVVINADHVRGGQSSSLRVGLAALRRAAVSPAFGSGVSSRRLDGVVFVNCDQPLLRARHIDVLLTRLEAAKAPGNRPAANDAIIIPVHSGQRGHPVLFGRGFFDDLSQVMGDEGGRSVIRRHPEAVVEVASDGAVLADVDTPEDFQDLAAKSKRGPA